MRGTVYPAGTPGVELFSKPEHTIPALPMLLDDTQDPEYGSQAKFLSLNEAEEHIETGPEKTQAELVTWEGWREELGLLEDRLKKKFRESSEPETEKKEVKEEKKVSQWERDWCRQQEEVREDLQDPYAQPLLELASVTEHRLQLYLDGKITERQLVFRKPRQPRKIRGSKLSTKRGYGDITEEEDLVPYKNESDYLIFPDTAVGLVHNGVTYTHTDVLKAQADDFRVYFEAHPEQFEGVDPPIALAAEPSEDDVYASKDSQADEVAQGIEEEGWYRWVDPLTGAFDDRSPLAESRYEDERSISTKEETTAADIAARLVEVERRYEASLNGKRGDPENEAALLEAVTVFLPPDTVVLVQQGGNRPYQYTPREALWDTNGKPELTVEQIAMVCATGYLNQRQGELNSETLHILPLALAAADMGIEVILR